MDSQSLALLTGAIALAALLYSSVGHAGASGYLAAMALFGVSQTVMKPTALALNLLVAIIASMQFIRAGAWKSNVLWPLIIGSAPMAFLGGSVTVPGHWFKPLIGICLLVASLRLIIQLRDGEEQQMPIWLGILIGAGIGFLSGLVGVGGGIFLSPILIFAHYSSTRAASGISATFIFVNSLAGLLGGLTSGITLPAEFPYFAGAAIFGGTIGSYLGSKKLAPVGLRWVLAVVLIVAGGKMILT